jgi:branched-chain amino acid aminotransferase
VNPAHFIQANTNGRLHSADEPSLSPLNRGYLYGDAIYEVWRTYAGVVFAWDEHWQRLLRSAASLHMALPFTADEIFAEIRKTVAAYRTRVKDAADLYIRIQVTRGGGAIGLDPALADRADFVLLVQPCPITPPEKIRSGLRLSLATALRRNPVDSLSPAWKTGNYLNNILCLREARARGGDEVVMINHAGAVTESAVSNIGFVRGGVVLTPPMSVGILGGITRDALLGSVAKAAGVVAKESTITPAEFATCEECFLLSTTKDVSPVSAIDDVKFKVGADTVAMRLKQAFDDYMRAYAAAHPRQKV